LPGRDVFYFDCRVLPDYDLDEVLAELRRMADAVEKERGVRIVLEVTQREQAASPTPQDSDIVVRIMKAVQKIYQVQPRPVGIGGGTVAAFLRRAGHHAVVWAKIEHTAHQPNETSSIQNTLGDAKVMAAALLGTD
jgi:succinyl-diaminopimelate desuccinylase